MLKKIKGILLLFLLLLIIYSLFRLIFYFTYFKHHGGIPLLQIFYWGMRLDFTALFLINCLFFFFYLFLYDLFPHQWRRTFAFVLFLVLNLPFLTLNCIDLAYYAFTNRRSTTDLLLVTGDSMGAVPNLLVKHWCLVLLDVATIAAIVIAFRQLIPRDDNTLKRKKWGNYIIPLVVLLAFAALARGFSSRPILPSTPLLYFNSEYQPLVNNSTFNFLYSVAKRQKPLQEKSYLSAPALESTFTLYRKYEHTETFQARNVVVFILESFCKEYLQDGNPYRSKTPFLDSIIAQSTWFSNGYANALMSNQGIVSILGSMPTNLDVPFYHSIYNNDRIRGIGTLLKEQGYATHFFMGAGPDHFGFGKFCNMIGIDHYHSGNEFGDNTFYDGHWGIYDHKFLPFAAGVLKKESSPFFSVIYNLSSHEPFTVPSDLSEQFDYPGQQPFQKAASYVDYSLRLFFDSVKNAPWYQKTFFIFVADHSIVSALNGSFSPFTSYRIPIFIFNPSKPVSLKIAKPMQQLDIVPSILDMLHYSHPFMSFGNSFLDSSSGRVINFYNGICQVMDSSYLFGYNETAERPEYLYDTATDPTLQNNLLHDPQYFNKVNTLLLYAKAVIQRYNNSLIKDSLYVK